MPRHLLGIRRYPRDGDSTGVRRYLPAGLYLAVFAALALAAAVATAGPARGQEELTLADFDRTGLDVEILVLVQASEDFDTSNVLWGRGRFLGVNGYGTLLDGGTSDVIPMLAPPAHPNDPDPADGNLIRIRRDNSGGSSVTLNDGGGLHLSSFFGTGAGNDLRVYFQTTAGVAYTAIADTGALGPAGEGYATFNLNAATATVFSGIGSGERAIFALARIQPNRAPEFAGTAAARTVSEDAADGSNVGAPVTATDADDGDELIYSMAGDPNFTIISTSGQIQVASSASLDYESATSHSVTVTASDGEAEGTIAVTVNVTDAADYSIAGVRIGSVTASTAEVLASLSNPEDEEGTVYLRYRTPLDSGAWTETTAAISGASARVTLTGLVDASTYQLEAAISGSYDGAETVSLTTRRAPLSVSASFSPASDVPLNTEVTVDLQFGGIRAQTNSGLTFRVDFAGGDACEGSGIGSVQSLATVDEDPEVRTATVTDGCPAGFHTLQVRVYDGGNLWVAQDFRFTVRSPTATPLPTPIPDVRKEASGAYGYITTVHLLVSPGGGGYGYAADDFGGLTAGRLPGVLFADGRERPVGEISVSSAGQLKIAYEGTQDGHFKDAEGLQWLRVRLRAADNSIIGGADLWDSSACGSQSICVGLDTALAAHDGLPVGVDFFDAVAETLDAAPGGMKNILIVAADTGSDGTGVDQSNGKWIGGGFPREWFQDGFDKPVEKVILWHGGSDRRIELGYDSAQTTGQWKYQPAAYRKHRVVLRDREGEEVMSWPMREALEAMNEDDRRCGDASPARRLCLAYHDSDLDPTVYRGQVLLLQVEDITWYAMLTATPGGPVGGQLALGVFGACMFGWRGRKTKSPQREWIILAAGAVSSCILPVFGYGDIFWAGAIVIIAVLAGAGWFFVARSR